MTWLQRDEASADFGRAAKIPFPWVRSWMPGNETIPRGGRCSTLTVDRSDVMLVSIEAAREALEVIAKALGCLNAQRTGTPRND